MILDIIEELFFSVSPHGRNAIKKALDKKYFILCTEKEENSREENISHVQKRKSERENFLQNIFFFPHIFMWGSARCKAASKRENWNKKVAEIIIRIKSHFGKWGNKFLKLARSNLCYLHFNLAKKNNFPRVPFWRKRKSDFWLQFEKKIEKKCALNLMYNFFLALSSEEKKEKFYL